jgi:putative ABC transport system permease protein
MSIYTCAGRVARWFYDQGEHDRRPWRNRREVDRVSNPGCARVAPRSFRFRLIEDARRDAGHGLRLLRRSPVFAATAAVSLAIGIGANTAIFTVANGLLLRPPTGIANPPALIDIGAARGDGGLNPVNYATYLEISRRVTSLTSVSAEQLFPHVMGLVPPGAANAETILGLSVTPNFFSVLGTVPSHGRLFGAGEEAAAVLNYDYWSRRFNRDAATIGQTIRINGRPVTIVGVAAQDFQGTGIQKCDVWLSIGATSAGNLMPRGRLRPGVAFEMAVAELSSMGEAIDRDRGIANTKTPRLSALPYSRAGGNRNVVLGFAFVLMVVVSLVLAAACANVAAVMLTRATARAREIALRAALGAGRGRLVRQLLTETLVLYLCSGLLAIGLARLLMRLAVLILPLLPVSLVVPLSLDWRVLSFAVSLSVLAAVVFGVLPAFKGSRVDARASLNDGTRGSTGRSRLRSAFVVGQIACSVMLVVLAALFVRVLRHAGAADPGFDSRRVDVATVNLSVLGEPNTGPSIFWRTMIDRVRESPSVERASLARVPPGGFEGIGLGGVAPLDRSSTAETFSPGWNIVDTGYFATLGIPMVAGRDFASSDTAGTPPVVVISDALARRFWPGQVAVGKPLRLAIFNARSRHTETRISTVVGVSGDIRSSSLIDGLAEPYVYLPLAQSDALGATDMTITMSIVARRRSGGSLAATMATIVQGIDPRLVLANAQSLSDAIALGLTPQRVLATLSGVMGLVAVLLASMGIYGVTAYTVTLRRRELAIRLALGAPRARIVRMVSRQSAWLVGLGLVLGLALALGAGQVLSVFFYGLPSAHLPTVLGTVALFFFIGAVASIVPARQAVRDGWRRALQAD